MNVQPIRNHKDFYEAFKAKIDELLAEGNNPTLGDGFSKNIILPQKKKMNFYEVLNAGQLKKYLNADCY